MKKYLLLIWICFFIIGCSNTKEKRLEEKKVINNIEEEKKEVELPKEPEYKDENPVIVGLYQNKKLIDTLNTTIKDGTDIASFDVYFTNDKEVSSTNTKVNFNKYASNYEDVNKYKIGFQISFSVDNDLINKVITSPKETYALTPYIYNYLYDDIHQDDGSWYSHVEEKDVNDDTIYSSIKLYAADNTDKITSPITLMVFTYDTEDDFDDKGMYRGNSKYTITINH